ncbi:hypothetical protein ACQKWADRAFT_327421 [Trichoderma austrokoningii]
MIRRSMLAAARNCTVLPISGNEAVRWQSGGCYRSTWNIISTCLSTIIACTWSIQHLNIPATDDSQWARNKRMMKWMMITVLFPELVLIHSMFEFHMAWKALRLMSKEQKSVEWPLWFRNPPLSWLPYCRRYLKDGDLENLYAQDDSKKIKWTLTHCYFANMGGFVFVAEGKRRLITAQQLAQDPLYTFPDVTEEDIQDKSKQDWLAKLFAALQILQLILSIIARRVQSEQFSQLETVTLSFAICGVLIYCTYFYKPQNVGRAIELGNNAQVSEDASQNKTNGAQDGTARFSSLQAEQTYDSFWAIMRNKQTAVSSADNSESRGVSRIPNDNMPVYRGSNHVHPSIYVLAVMSGLFGAIHALAWQFEFPTEEEKLLWQIATCVSAASPVVGLLAIPFAQFTKASGDPELFAGNCLRLLQEYSWRASDVSWTGNAIEALEDAIANNEPKRWSKIFAMDEAGISPPILELGDFLDLRGDFDLYHDKWFVRSFHRLVNSMNGKETKKIDDAARTDAWPRQPLLPHGVNQGILYFTGFLYCAARLILLAVAISSIRKMPGSVYLATSWTEYLPTFGAMGG